MGVEVVIHEDVEFSSPKPCAFMNTSSSPGATEDPRIGSPMMVGPPTQSSQNQPQLQHSFYITHSPQGQGQGQGEGGSDLTISKLPDINSPQPQRPCNLSLPTNSLGNPVTSLAQLCNFPVTSGSVQKRAGASSTPNPPSSANSVTTNGNNNSSVPPQLPSSLPPNHPLLHPVNVNNNNSSKSSGTSSSSSSSLNANNSANHVVGSNLIANNVSNPNGTVSTSITTTSTTSASNSGLSGGTGPPLQQPPHQQPPPMNLSFPRIPPSPDSALGGWSTPSSNLSRHNSDASQRSFSSSSNNTTPPSPSNSPLLIHNQNRVKCEDFGKNHNFLIFLQRQFLILVLILHMNC